jgi:hypothetical protein
MGRSEEPGIRFKERSPGPQESATAVVKGPADPDPAGRSGLVLDLAQL